HSWVGGHEMEGRGGRRAAINPASGQPFAEATLLDASQALSAIEAARAAFPAWSAATFEERGRLLLRVRDLILEEGDEIARLIATEQGKPQAEAHLVELFPSLDALKHLAHQAEELLRDDAVESQTVLLAHKECRLTYAPYGVVLLITPWNYPF